ncbi:MAG: hypothetical protein KKA91_10155 [Alphaproteobacteria bacterium]|nr:hypothetical protein [Alphaproteobacteria bacterium]
MLLEPADRLCWTHASKLLAGVVRPQLLSVDSVAQKCRLNENEHGAALPSDLGAGQVFKVFSPKALSAACNDKRPTKLGDSDKPAVDSNAYTEIVICRLDVPR